MSFFFKYLNIAFKVLRSNVYLFLKRITGCNLRWNIISLVSSGSSLRSDNGGLIILGKRVALRDNTEIFASNGVIKLSDRCFINRNCMIIAHEQITIEEGTTIGPNVCIYDHDHDGKGGFVTSPVLIGKNVWIGAGVIILRGVHIGDNTIIAAGTVLKTNVKADTLCYQKRETIVKDLKRV